MKRLTDARLEEIVKGNGGFLEMAVMAREILLLRAECRAAREMRRVFNRLSLHANDVGPIQSYDVASRATDDAGFCP